MLRSAFSRNAMFKIIDRAGKTLEIEFETGSTIYEAVEDSDMGENVLGVCGGNGMCGKCAVHLGEHFDSFGEPDDDELSTLARSFDVKKDTRLACQCELDEDLHDGITIVSAKWA